jgi:hypothetical protein
MIEILAALAGASFSVAAMSLGGLAKRNGDAREAVTRLTLSVEHIVDQLSLIHQDIKEDRRETFKRLGQVEQRVSKLEAVPPWEGKDRRST